jgi:hypothetical protein
MSEWEYIDQQGAKPVSSTATAAALNALQQVRLKSKASPIVDRSLEALARIRFQRTNAGLNDSSALPAKSRIMAQPLRRSPH